MSLGERIRKLRKEKRLTLVALGAKIGMTNGALSQIETDKANPSDRTLKLLAHEFGVNEAWLRTGEGEMKDSATRKSEVEVIVENLLSGEAPEMRLRLVKVFSELSDKQLWLVEAKLWEILTGEILTPEAMKERIRKYDALKALSAPSDANFYRVPQDMTPEELHAELDRQLADEKERGDGSADSGFGNSGTAAG